MASITAGSPVPAGCSRRTSARTCSTEADDRLPTAASEARVGSRASAGRPRVSHDGVDHLGPARVGDPVLDVGDVEALVGEEALHVGPEVAADDVGHRGGEHDPQP